MCFLFFRNPNQLIRYLLLENPNVISYQRCQNVLVYYSSEQKCCSIRRKNFCLKFDNLFSADVLLEDVVAEHASASLPGDASGDSGVHQPLFRPDTPCSPRPALTISALLQSNSHHQKIPGKTLFLTK